MAYGLVVSRALLIAAVLIAALPRAQAQSAAGDDAPLRFGRFEHDGKVHFGFLAAGGIHELDGSFLSPQTRLTGRRFKRSEVRLLAPVIPGKVIAVALNYKAHGGTKSKEPGFFAKLPSAILETGGTIVAPPGSTSLHYEGEMVIVISRRASKVPVARAKDYIFGVTIGNDVTERGYAFSPFNLLRSKGADTLSPLGPWIVRGLNIDNLKIVTRLNGKVVQNSSTAKMIFSSAQIVAVVSRYITLEPGDVIYTGTPGRTRAMTEGDRIEISLEGVGTLKNIVGVPAPKP